MFDSVEIQNQSILARDAASVLNALASVATETGLHDGGNGLGLDRIDGYAKNGGNSAFLGIQRSAVPQPLDGSPNGINPGKKGRSKACDECRKSKASSHFYHIITSHLDFSLTTSSVAAYMMNTVGLIRSKLKNAPNLGLPLQLSDLDPAMTARLPRRTKSPDKNPPDKNPPDKNHLRVYHMPLISV
jgi:hypothetical protein